MQYLIRDHIKKNTWISNRHIYQVINPNFLILWLSNIKHYSYLVHIKYVEIRVRGSENLLEDIMMNCFCGIGDRQKAFSFISSWNHCQRTSPLWVSDTPGAAYEPEFRLDEWRCAVGIITTPLRQKSFWKFLVDRKTFFFLFS